MGDDVNAARKFMKQDEKGRWSYSATEVVEYILSAWEAAGGDAVGDQQVAADGVVVPSSSSAEVVG